uniref:Uncharacterized protein n=1 Tax=Oryza meridionalis TaxID=40149 RepID=A0A0E0F215_9ORYZ
MTTPLAAANSIRSLP